MHEIQSSSNCAEWIDWNQERFKWTNHSVWMWHMCVWIQLLESIPGIDRNFDNAQRFNGCYELYLKQKLFQDEHGSQFDLVLLIQIIL